MIWLVALLSLTGFCLSSYVCYYASTRQSAPEPIEAVGGVAIYTVFPNTHTVAGPEGLVDLLTHLSVEDVDWLIAMGATWVHKVVFQSPKPKTSRSDIDMGKIRDELRVRPKMSKQTMRRILDMCTTRDIHPYHGIEGINERNFL